MKYVFYKQRRIIKIDDSKLWVGGEIKAGQTIIVRHTWQIVKSVKNKDNDRIINLTSVRTVNYINRRDMVIYYKKGKKTLCRKFDDFVPNKGVELILGDESYIVSNVKVKLESNEVTIDLEDKA